jgi:hypothetical protein
MSKRQMIETLLEAHEDAICAGESEECARQFMLWMNHVASALDSAGMADECIEWKGAQENVRFSDDEPSFPAQSASMKAILLGILVKLKESEQARIVDQSRIEELQAISSVQFDLMKLIKLCEELNVCYANECWLAVIMLTRAVLDHIPPILGHQTFVEVANNYGGRSLKGSMQHLQDSSRNIADMHLHQSIRARESLPNGTQIDFSNDLDVLLAEIVRVLR